MLPARSTARETGASFSKDRWRAYLIIIFQVRQQYVTEVPLSEHNNVVKAFPSDRTDQPFRRIHFAKGSDTYVGRFTNLKLNGSGTSTFADGK